MAKTNESKELLKAFGVMCCLGNLESKDHNEEDHMKQVDHLEKYKANIKVLSKAIDGISELKKEEIVSLIKDGYNGDPNK